MKIKIIWKKNIFFILNVDAPGEILFLSINLGFIIFLIKD